MNLVRQKAGFAHLILILLVVLVFLAVGLYFVAGRGMPKETMDDSATSRAFSPIPSAILQTQYANPFDESTQSSNPFTADANYQNPFDTLGQ